MSGPGNDGSGVCALRASYALENQVKQEYRLLLLLFCCEMQIAVDADAAVTISSHFFFLHFLYFFNGESWPAAAVFSRFFFCLVGVRIHKVNKRKMLAKNSAPNLSIRLPLVWSFS